MEPDDLAVDDNMGEVPEPSVSVDDPYMYRYKPSRASSSDSETVTTLEARGDSYNLGATP